MLLLPAKVTEIGGITMKKLKVSVYLSVDEKEVIQSKADSVNQSISSYLLNTALEKTIESSKIKSGIVSTACKIYRFADTLESLEQRKVLKGLAGALYGNLEG